MVLVGHIPVCIVWTERFNVQMVQHSQITGHDNYCDL